MTLTDVASQIKVGTVLVILLVSCDKGEGGSAKINDDE